MITFENEINNPNIALWRIEESEKDLHKIVSEFDWINEHLKEITHQAKRIEYLASRVLLKKLCQKLNIKFDGVFKDEHLKPYLVGNNGHISISHSSDYCAAIYSKDNSVGIDIQPLEKKLHKVSKKFLSDLENDKFNKNLELLCRAWCAKEAIYKMVGKKGVSLRNQIKIIELNQNFAFVEAIFENINYQSKVQFYSFENFIVGYTI
ncbi:MAG: 4'-phosphopantetheinyl transferase superfamily protein [Cytophagales bacterium]|nr:MAG: 4'-phosphopantetheinyl transferase superfamily protein [Cytophagales bacterium]